MTEARSEQGVRAKSGRPVSELTLEAVRRGEIGLEDLRIHPDTLERQAAVAKQHANPQLAQNLRRAAELTRLTDEAIEARYHTTVIALMALERAWVKPDAPPEELSLEGLR